MRARAEVDERAVAMMEDANHDEVELATLRLEGLAHLNRLQSGDATERDEFAFLAWRAQSIAHEEAFRSAVHLQRLVRRAEDGDPFPAETVSPPQRAKPRLGRRAFLGGAIAASAAGIAIMGRSLELVPTLGEMRADYRTGTGERRLVQLAGGAAIDLNTRTSILLHSGAGMPTVELISGEAIMTSGAGADGRSALLAGNGNSVGQHARFSARRTGDDVCITCLAGVVDVTWRDRRQRLQARQQIRYDDENIDTIAAADTRLVSAWQSGTLIFQAMPMRKVVAEINRYRPGRVILTNERLGSRTLTGTYYVNRLDDFFQQAELAFGVNVTRLPGGVVILA